MVFLKNCFKFIIIVYSKFLAVRIMILIFIYFRVKTGKNVGKIIFDVFVNLVDNL